MTAITWFDASTNQRHSAFSILHFTFRIPRSPIPHFTHYLIGYRHRVFVYHRNITTAETIEWYMRVASSTQSHPTSSLHCTEPTSSCCFRPTRVVMVSAKWTEWMAEILFSFDVSVCLSLSPSPPLSVYMCMQRAGQSATSLKLLKLRTSNLTGMFSVTVNFYPRDAMLARVFATATCPSVCPSVCHTPVLCPERKQDREMYTFW